MVVPPLLGGEVEGREKEYALCIPGHLLIFNAGNTKGQEFEVPIGGNRGLGVHHSIWVFFRVLGLAAPFPHGFPACSAVN